MSLRYFGARILFLSSSMSLDSKVNFEAILKAEGTDMSMINGCRFKIFK